MIPNRRFAVARRLFGRALPSMVRQELSATGRILAVEGYFLIHGELMNAERLGYMGAFERSRKPDRSFHAG